MSLKVTREEQLFFWEQLALLIPAGISLITALSLLSESSSKNRQKRFLMAVKGLIESGTPFSEALCKVTSSFSQLNIALVEVGEASGRLPEIFEYIAILEKEAALSRKGIRKAVSYPLMVISVAIFVLGFILLSVVPMFDALYQASGTELPKITQTILSISNSIVSFNSGLYLLLCMLFLFWSYRKYRKKSKFRSLIDRFLLKIPYVGFMLRLNFTRHLSMAVSMMLQSGITLVSALELFKKSIKNSEFQKEITEIRARLLKGDDFYRVVQEIPKALPLFKTMTAVGVTSGDLVGSLKFVGHYYGNIFNQKIEFYIALLEPISILLVGVIVGVILIALYLPLFNLGMAL